MSPPSHAERAGALLQDADLCVKCGLCLPHCPTYLDSEHEADSPRGRIALAQGLIGGTLADGASLRAHLDGCLSCRKCEAVCPARVPYGRILDAARQELAARDPQPDRSLRWLSRLLVPAPMRVLLRGLIALYRGSGLQRLTRRSGVLGNGRLARLESLLPVRARAQTRWYIVPGLDAGTDASPEVALFRGCVGDVLEREVLAACATLLRAAGYRVHVPSAQTCCGALHLHGGQREQARRLAQRNVEAFDGAGVIASFTSGCAASLRDYADLDLEGKGVAFADRVQDVMALLQARLDRLQFRPLARRAALHLPCTLANVMQAGPALRRVLAAVPDLELIELDPPQHCCGAAGRHFLTHAEASDRLLAPKLRAIEALRPDLVLSSNIGCSLHLRGGLTRLGQADPPVIHPAILLAGQLVPPGPRS